MSTVLGIDAAWTVGEPSGVALVQSVASSWRCLAVAPSYEAFARLACGEAVDWRHGTVRRESVGVTELLEAATTLAGRPVDVIAVDMPMATVPIVGRRHADNEVSAEFGARWCSAHTPSAARPGPVGLAMSTGLVNAGYPLSTRQTGSPSPALIEVYPHPALLSLLRKVRRIPYKVSKANKYWPGATITERTASLLGTFAEISAALEAAFGDTGLQLPPAISVSRLADLKRYEDALDALVCAWVGVEHLAGRTTALGDHTAAIWCPTDVVVRRSRKAG